MTVPAPPKPAASLQAYRAEVESELKDNILPFWLDHAVDFDGGTFHGAVDASGKAEPLAEKGVILAARMLWTFSRAGRFLRHEKSLKAAQLMARFFRNQFIDSEYGGVHWMLDWRGRPQDSTKKIYAQAFAVYALSEYAAACSDERARDEALEIFNLIENHGRDPLHGGYLDARGRDWSPIADTRLSDKDLNSPKSMNTNLHVLEAYAGFLEHGPHETVRTALADLTEVFMNHLCLPSGHLGLFFEKDWREVSGCTSYGHDIEGSWLLMEAAQRSGAGELPSRAKEAAMRLAQAVVRDGLDTDGILLNEREANGHLTPGREWWVPAEAMVGFFNAWQISGDEQYLKRSRQSWDFCKSNFIRPQGEWYSRLDGHNQPDLTERLAGPWKCPYHNGRACLEIAQRIAGWRPR